MRVGLLGGTFDPIHYGHLLMAEQCREQCVLDVVRFIPAWNPPHKQTVQISSSRDRIAMLELALAGDPRMEVCLIEIERQGISFTVETLRQLHQQSPADDYFLIIGADSLEELPSWREPSEILRLAQVVAVNRGRAEPEFHSVVDALGEQVRERIAMVDMPAIDLSATDIRRRVAEGRSIRHQTPPAVAMYIKEHQLYRSR